MIKRLVLVILSVLCVSIYTYSIDAWIRINQMGYLPNAAKKAVLLSESDQDIKQFSVHDALTNEELAVFNTVVSKGEFQSFKSTYVLEFSKFKQDGAFYIKAGLIYSPTIYINKNVYLGSADFLLNFIRQQRCGNNIEFKTDNHPMEGYETTGNESKSSDVRQSELLNFTATKSNSRKSSRKPMRNIELEAPKSVDVVGGWHDNSSLIQNGSTAANSVYQMLFAYQMNPTAFADKFDAKGNEVPNGIPDILDEAKWGLDWLLKMYPEKDLIYHQVGDNVQTEISNISFDERVNVAAPQDNGRPVYIATGKPQGLSVQNHSNGIASIAGKYSSAFALGSQILAKFYPVSADSLKIKATNAYELGKNYPGVCQSVPYKSGVFYEEDNWSDDMELAAAQLYQLTYDPNYLKEAARFGRMEPVSPWMYSDTTAHYQWYPFINLGHFLFLNVENPRFQKEFQENLLSGIRRMSSYASANPFNVGVPLVMNSNNLVVALASQCRLYRTLTNDSSFVDMEVGLTDWLFGRNPWGKSMVAGFAKNGNVTSTVIVGGLVSGPVHKNLYSYLQGVNLSKDDPYARFQSDWAVFHDDNSDFVTNVPSFDGTASLSYLLSGRQSEGIPGKLIDKNEYEFGAVTRTDTTKKQICLVFAGHQFNDGHKIIRNTLKKLNIKASFFFTGDFYRSQKNKPIIDGLIADNHYLGGNSDKYLQYSSFRDRDSMLVNKTRFVNDLKANYKAMERFGIAKNQAPFFLPPHEWHNDSISNWCSEVGVKLINCTPGLLSNFDTSTPEMRDNYYPTTEIYKRILETDSKEGLNGSILLFHIGSDYRRKDKFYTQLNTLLVELSKRGYEFVDLYKATDLVDKPKKEEKNTEVKTEKKEKRKN